jgi:glucoamylase
MQSLDAWLDEEYHYAAHAMLSSVSRIDLIHERSGFGQCIRPLRGSIVASPVPGDWTREPDYFFHWFRDSALVADALRMLYRDGEMGAEPLAHFRDYVRFSLALQATGGRHFAAQPSWRAAVAPAFVRYLRSDQELAAVCAGDAVAEARVNPDGTLDISRWSRPQYDGAPLRALTVLRWMRSAVVDPGFAAELGALARSDLAFTARHWRDPSYDIWEEEKGCHYYALRISAAALGAGAAWLEAADETELANGYRAQARAIRDRLDTFWSDSDGFYRSRISAAEANSGKDLDTSVVLAAIHAGGDGTAHTARDPRIHATLRRLEKLFGATYPINAGLAPQRAPAMGRYTGDTYFSGGAYYFSTLGAAELCFRAATCCAEADAWFARGDAFLATVRAFTPPGGELSEQFDQRTGLQTSARHLAWSYAAFISCMTARRGCMACLQHESRRANEGRPIGK